MLAKGAGAEIVGTLTARRDRPDAKYFIGSGKADEGVAMAKALLADIVLFDQPLSPAQQRNLERAFNLRVVDRVALILDIFALRAKSHEGKLQVELAQLQHLATRLTRMWSHLERQRGGIGMRCSTKRSGSGVGATCRTRFGARPVVDPARRTASRLRRPAARGRRRTRPTHRRGSARDPRGIPRLRRIVAAHGRSTARAPEHGPLPHRASRSAHRAFPRAHR